MKPTVEEIELGMNRSYRTCALHCHIHTPSYIQKQTSVQKHKVEKVCKHSPVDRFAFDLI